ncbi:hypothetical protein HK101_005693, partial [Irineochytrium annulatum]
MIKVLQPLIHAHLLPYLFPNHTTHLRDSDPPPPYHGSFHASALPFSTFGPVALAVVSYLSLLYGIQTYMKERKPVQLNGLFMVHNAILSLGSAALLIVTLEEVVPQLWEKGVLYAFCSPEAYTP